MRGANTGAVPICNIGGWTADERFAAALPLSFGTHRQMPVGCWRPRYTSLSRWAQLRLGRSFSASRSWSIRSSPSLHSS